MENQNTVTPTADAKPRQAKQVRNFFIRTYLTYPQIRTWLSTISFQHYAFICHDKEDCEQHTHILLRLNNPTSKKSIASRLKAFGYGLDNGKNVNSDVEICEDIHNAFLYLTHETPACKETNKRVYRSEEIVSDDIGYFRGQLRNSTAESVENNAYQIICDMEKEVPLRELVRRYGREFVINYEKYRFMVELIGTQEAYHRAVRLEKKKKQHKIKKVKELLPADDIQGNVFEEIENETYYRKN